jgi:hypothetical protein
MYYGARWYDVSLGRFAQADMVVPSGVQGYDRYAFVYNNPLKYIDPSGHNPCSGAVSGYKCHREIDRARAWDQAHQSDDPIRHTLYLGGFTLTSATEELDQDEETQQITNRWQWIIEFIALIKEIGEGFQPMPNRGPNVKIYLSYDQFENGSLDNFSISVKNRSEGVVYVANVKFSINSADYSPCAKCGDFFVRPTQSDYLSTIKAGQTNNIDLCSNCLASPGMVDFLPISNGHAANITIRFFVPEMSTPFFNKRSNISAYR